MRISLPGVSRPFFSYVAVAAVVITAGQTGRLEDSRWRADACPVLTAVKSENRVIESDRVNYVQRKDRFPAAQVRFWKLRIPQPHSALQAVEGSTRVHASA